MEQSACLAFLAVLHIIFIAFSDSFSGCKAIWSTSTNRINGYFKQLYDIINLREPDSYFIILGDFNLSCIEWYFENNRCIALNHEGRLAEALLDTLNLTGLKQVNFIKNNFNRILDLTLTNINNVNTSLARGIVGEDSYHPAFTFKLDPNDVKFMKCKKSTKINFRGANYIAINERISSVNWHHELNNLNSNEATDKFYIIINNIISQMAPKIKPKVEGFPKWFSNDLIKLVREKETYFNLIKRTNGAQNEIYKSLFKQKRKEIKRKKKLDLSSYQRNIESLIKTNPKSFFAYTKSLRKSNKLLALMRLKNKTSENIGETANLFAEYFSSVYTQNNETYNFQCNGDCNNYFQITEQNIRDVINSLDKTKTNSPDGIPATFYVNTIESILVPLKILFNKYTREMIYPDAFKTSFVSPIHKSGDEDNIENYRPICILPAVAKIFDKLIHIYLNNKTKHLITAKQHGFTGGKSTSTNLLEYTNYLTNKMMGGGQIDAIYTDLAKAFDKINHTTLLDKISRLPISHCLVKLLHSYLVDRKQYVCVYGEKSNCITPQSSVPQGSILSPLLFALFINDLSPRIHSEILMFADDVKIFLKINDIADARQLQQDINTILNWCIENKLELNVNKCYVISFTRRSDITYQYFNYNINGNTISRVNTMRDLGITFDSKLYFINHMKNIID